MFLFRHILENLDGFDCVKDFPGSCPDGDDANGITVADPTASICDEKKCEYPDSISVRRTPPTNINTRLTRLLGLGGDIPDLQAFDIGAVVQHYPITLNRRLKGKDPDFRLPRVKELEALEAFQQSLLLPKDVAQSSFDPFGFVMPGAQERGAEAFQAGVFEPATGSAGKCIGCHGAPFVDGIPVSPDPEPIRPTLDNSVNFNTGVNALAFSQALPFDNGGEEEDGAVCGSDELLGNGSCAGGSFNVPALIGIKDTSPFFHNGVSPTLRDAVLFYALVEFRQSTGGQFIQALTGSPINLGNSIDDIVAFLEALGQTPSEAITALISHIEDDLSFKARDLEEVLISLLVAEELEDFKALVAARRGDFVSDADADGLINGADLIIEEIEKG